jgi:hypothetical protein
VRDAATKRLLGLSALAGVFVLWGCEPSTSGTCAATPEEVWIVQSLFFGRIDGATSPGFNLDAIQGMQCGARDYVSPEGERGIDNQFGGLLPIVEAQAVGGMPLDYLVQDSIASGQILLAFELGGVDAMDRRWLCVDAPPAPERNPAPRHGQPPLVGADTLPGAHRGHQ